MVPAIGSFMDMNALKDAQSVADIFNDEIKKYKDVLSNARLTTKMTPEQKKGYETAIQTNTVKIHAGNKSH